MLSIRNVFSFLFLSTQWLLTCITVAQDPAKQPRPNIVILLADDMGYGEVQCLNPTRGKISTPQLDAIAASGMTFTDAHSGSSVCTPTRYGLLTGRYAWRTTLQSGVMTGGASLIAEDRLTLAKLLHSAGYHTAAIGKWHLGMLFDGRHRTGDVKVGSKITQGPLDRGGFNEFHGFHHAAQIKVWIDNDQVTQILEPVEMLPKLTRTAVEYIRGRKGKNDPFFLYVLWNSPHSPVVPSAEWRGRSGLNAHADFVMQTDDSFGQVMNALRETGTLENTLVICSSDNGTSAPTANRKELEAKGHYSSADLRGSKADIWDGGNRVPFLVSWPRVVKPGSRCDRLVCLTDIIATVTDILHVDLPDTAAEDSFSFLPALKGSSQHDRRYVIHHSIYGYFAIRHGNWKLCCCPGSGGWTEPAPTAALWKETKDGICPFVQLYDMDKDISEQRNLANESPELTRELRAMLDEQIALGRSTPGTPQKNDTQVIVDKQPAE